jgi:predicted RNase H-like HicB family nuclease
MLYLVRVYRYNGDCNAMAPDIPGCVAAGASLAPVI